MKTYCIDDYPQLRSVCWSIRDGAEISGEDALKIYERNWEYVDGEAMSDDELVFLANLVLEHGNGVLFVSDRFYRLDAYFREHKLGQFAT